MPSSFTLLKRSFSIFKEHFKSFFLIISVPAAFNFLMAFYEPNFEVYSLDISVAGFYLLLLLISLCLSALMSIALIHAIADTSLSVVDAYKIAKTQFFKYLGLVLLVTIVIIAGFILLVIPGIWLSVALSFSAYFCLLQGRGLKGSMYASKDLVKGRWWDVAIKMFFLTCVGIVFVIVLGMIASSVSAIANNTLLGTAMTGALSLLMTPLANIYLYQLFLSLQTNSTQITPEQTFVSPEVSV